MTPTGSDRQVLTGDCRTPARAVRLTNRVAASDECDVCGSPDLAEIRCKLICRNCRTILRSCADL